MLLLIVTSRFNGVNFNKMNQEQKQNELLETELFNRVLLNRIEQKRDQIKQLKAENYKLKNQLKQRNGRQLIKEVFSFVGVFFLCLFLIFGIYKAIL